VLFFFNTASNNGMHPTADTPVVMLINGSGRRVMPALGGSYRVSK
jgi:hypothetical protein